MGTSRRNVASSSTTMSTTPTRRSRSASTPSHIATRRKRRPACAASAWRFDTPLMARESAQEFEHWLAEGGLRNMPLSDLFNGLTQYLLQGGVPIAPASFRLLS